MAKVVTITLELTIDEATAVHTALGHMTGTAYANDVLASAGSDIYSELSPLMEEDE